MNTVPRAEAAILYGVAARALDRMLTVTVYDHEDKVGGPHTDIKSVLNDAGHTEVTNYELALPNGKRIGSVTFIHGNGPEDNPADYSWIPGYERLVSYIASPR